jgi:ppGpp synthetase/RelA/SpoT-type nucleotidyltranferase
MSEQWVRQFEEHTPALRALGAAVHERLDALLKAAAVPVSFITWRLKEPRSLAHKLARPDRSYRALWDVTDLVGLRVSVSFEDHLERVARLIEQHFRVDLGHSLERVRPAGYRAVHYVCAHERAPHPDFRFEVQVRTALQHAWAEMEHDLGYKASDAVPEAIRRRFSRVAALLEIADQEFVSIRRDLERSRDEAKAALASNADDLPLDLVSLDALARTAAVERVDQALATRLGQPLVEATFFAGYLVEVLRLCGLTTTQAVLRAVEQFGPLVHDTLDAYASFARAELGFDTGSLDAVERGYALLFVAHLAVARGPELAVTKVSRLTRLYHQLEFPDDERKAQRVASAAIAALG